MVRTWQDALDTLYTLRNWETRPAGSSHVFELSRIRAVLSHLDDPHHAWPAVHVAGTNGKGSICAYLESILRHGGYRTGLFTSPHLHTLRERIQVNRELIDEAFVIEWLNHNRSALLADGGVTTFEALTALAFSYFAAQRVDVAVVEVGLGGRLDTTNVVNSVVSVITPIGLDHTKVLGDTLAEIARDKAGILRNGVPAVSAPQAEEALAVLEDAAVAVGAPLTLVGRDARISLAGAAVHVEVAGAGGYNLTDRLPGDFQTMNAATAVTAAALLSRAGWHVDQANIERGISQTRWPARFEIMPRSDSNVPTLLVDGAHNPHAAGALVSSVRSAFPGRPIHLILGFGTEKDAAGIVAPWVGVAATVTVMAARHPKARESADAAAVVRAAGMEVTDGVRAAEALEAVLGKANSDDVIVATGSLFVAAGVREAWLRRFGLPLPPLDGLPPDRR